MLAYVFWHWHNLQIDANTYQQHLQRFHQTLSAHKPEGFHSSRMLVMQQFPWLERTEQTYEDWYIVENSAALDPLNEAAVGGVRREPHNQVARWTEGGTAGLYRLQFGEARLPTVRFAYRFSKPANLSYAALYDLLQPLEKQIAGSLWIRQMTLGPGPEFCFHASQEIALPQVLNALKIPVQQIWVSM